LCGHFCFFFQAEDGIRDFHVTGVQTCALPISVREHEAAVLIATIALALIFQELMLYTFGGSFLGVPSTLEGSMRVFGVSVPYQRSEERRVEKEGRSRVSPEH